VVWSRPKKRAANPFEEAAPAGADDGFEPRTDDSPANDAFAPANELVDA
jgi:hypothetical protein